MDLVKHYVVKTTTTVSVMTNCRNIHILEVCKEKTWVTRLMFVLKDHPGC